MIRMELNEDEQKLQELRGEVAKKGDENRKLRQVLRELFDALENAILVARFILYVGSAAGAWFYLKDHALAVAIVASLTVAHGLIAFREYVLEKRKELTS